MDRASIKQLKTTNEQHNQIQRIAHATNTTICKVVNDAVQEFLNYRAALETAHHEYLTSPEPSKYRSYWIHDDLLAVVKQYAVIDGVSQNRILYTSIFKLCQRDK